MLKKTNILLLFFCLFATSLVAQDTLLFLNGKILEGEILSQTNFEFSFKNKKNKQFSIEKYRVFSTKVKQKETIIYKYDTLNGNHVTVNDMKLFVYGERDAHKTYASTFTNIVGLAIGGATGYLMHKDQSFVYITVPLLYAAVTLPFGTNIKKQNQLKETYLKENEYLKGYDRVARGKRTPNAIKSSFIGMSIGFLISSIVNK